MDKRLWAIFSAAIVCALVSSAGRAEDFPRRAITMIIPFAPGGVTDQVARLVASKVASLFYLTPPFTALMAWLMFDEQLSPLALAGIAVCVAGVALVNWRAGKARFQ